MFSNVAGAIGSYRERVDDDYFPVLDSGSSL